MTENELRPGGRLMAVDEALQQIQSSLSCSVDSESVPLREAAGRILCADHHAAVDVPPFANSAMDGYAIRSGDLDQGQRVFTISGRVPAGQAPGPLVPGTAVRIFTGAPMPSGADTVVMQENCRADAVKSTMTVVADPSVGENVRGAGADIRSGERLLSAGRRLTAADVGTLAACGVDRVKVRTRLKVIVLPTGNELVSPGQPLRPGQIHNSNAFVLHALLDQLGMEVMGDGEPLPDDLSSTRQALLRAAGGADAVLTCGGVSAGEEDHVRTALQEVGELTLWKIALKPGKPFAFGRVGPTPMFGLPGNPVSAFITFLLLVRPALLKLAGASDTGFVSYRLPAGFERARSGERQEYLRVRVRDGDSCTGQQLVPMPEQSSGVLTSVSRASGVVVIPPFTEVREGDILQFIPFGEWGG
ncbi:MAG: gephyrin-like molybdotransferase Glp [Pseudomonadota bacterium]